MRKRMRLSAMLLLVSLLLTACWDQRPIEDLALIAGIGIDLYPANPNLLNFSFVYPLYLDDKRQGEKVELIAASNLGEAINMFEKRNAWQFAGGKVRVMAFGEDAARKGLAGLMEYIQLPMVDDNAFVVVTDQAYKLWEVQVPETERNAFHIQNMLRNAFKEGETLRVTVGKLITEATALGVDAVVPLLTRPDEWRFNIDGAALFRDLQMVDTISQDELRMLMALLGEIAEVSVAANVGVSEELAKPVVEFELLAPKARIKPKLEDGQLQVGIEFSSRCILCSYDSKADLTEPDVVRAIATDLESYLLIEMGRLLTKLQELRVDPLGVGKRLRAQNPKQFDSKQFREQWAQAQIELKVELQIVRVGVLHKNVVPGRR